MWKSKKFESGATGEATSKECLKALVEEHFDFNASEDAEPAILRPLDVLEAVGVAQSKANTINMGKVLCGMVGPQRFMRVKGVFGRYYALPPRKEPWL